MYECRFAELFHPVTGVITWISNPAQPSFVWQLHSHDLEPHAALFATRHACEPLHLQFNQSTDHLQIINVTPTARRDLHVRLRLFDLESHLLSNQTLPANAPALAATDLGPTQFPENLPDLHFLKLELFDAGNPHPPDGSPLLTHLQLRSDISRALFACCAEPSLAASSVC
ncbi:MAG: hypothetical protein ACTHN5_15125 [Phycisphaerae bacterium]